MVGGTVLCLLLAARTGLGGVPSGNELALYLSEAKTPAAQKTVLKEALGKPHFFRYLHIETLEEGEAEVWGRSLHHTQGKDIQLPKKLFKVREGRVSKLKWIITRKGNRVQREVETHKIVEKMGTNPKWETSDFWVKVIPSQEEFRQHVWKGNVIRRGKKEGGQEVTRKYPSVLIRSRQNGFHINYGPFESPRGMKDLAKKAVSVLGYKGGAVDLLQGRDGILYVLEVNSAPSLKDDNTLKAYVDGVKRDGV